MDENGGFLQSIIGKIGEFFLWLKEKMADDQVRRDTLLDLGLDPDKDVKLQIPDESVNNIDQYRKSVNPDDVAFQSAVNDVKILFSSIKEFIKAVIDDPKDADTYIWLFLEVNTTNYIRLHYPVYYWISQLAGFTVEARATIQTAVEGQGLPETVHHIITEAPKVIVKNIWNLITDPLDYFKNIWKKITEPRGGQGHLETIESAEHLSELMTALAVLFTIFESKLPESRYLFGWSTLPRSLKENSSDELKNTILGNLLLKTIRKEHDNSFPVDQDEALNKIKDVLQKKAENKDLTDVEKKILGEYNIAVNRWKRGNWSDLVSERAFSFDLKLPEDEESEFDKRLGATLFFVADEEISEHFNKDSGVQNESLGGLFISLNGELSYTHPINDNWEFKLKTSSGSALSVYLSRLPDADILGDMKLELGLKRKIDPETGASYNLPDEKGTRLAVGEIQISAFLSKDDAGIEIGLKDNAVVISGGEGDSFLNEIMPSGDVPLKFSVSTGFTRKKGFYIDHNIGLLKDILGSPKEDEKKKEPAFSVTDRPLTATIPGSGNKATGENTKPEKQPYQLMIPIHKDLDFLYFDNVKWDYGPVTKEGVLGGYIKVLTTFSSKLGPLVVRVENTGLGIEVSTPDREGDLGTTDFSFGFTPPKGVALRLDSEIISGGGFLELDFDNNRYAGVMNFKLALEKRDIELVAIGLINTRLPNGEKGFSMLISISVFFAPAIPLSFGFTLNAVGGLVGIHRTMKVDVLRERIQNGAVKSIMFPENVIVNASKIISDLRAVFPPQKKHYVVAPFFKIGYSTPTIVEIDLGILLEFPFKGRFIILGSLGIYLPNKEVKKRLGEIHVDIFGDFNFAGSYILIEGRLRDSNITGVILTGGFAFVLDWGSSPQFLLSVGGYHPRYKKPARFPDISRITALIKKGDDIRLSCNYYQAITSNSYQIGFSAEMVVKKGNIRALGFLGFNALLQFDPFYFEIDIRISVEVSYRGRSFFGIEMEFTLSGPEPWRAKGFAKISVLFFSLKVKFNVSWGDEQKVVPVFVKPDELLEKLKIQLLQSGNWTAKFPVAFTNTELLRSLDENEKKEQIIIHPSGYLELSQNLIPLNKTLEKIGNSYVEEKTSYQITDYAFGKGTPINTQTQNLLQDYFSRGHFEDLADDEKLSTPDFDLMSAGIRVTPNQLFDIPAGNIQSTPNDFEDIILDETGSNKPTEKSFNWQEERGMNLSGIKKSVDTNRPEKLFGVVEELPVQKEKAFKILSKETLESPAQLKEQYFVSYSGAKDYLQKNWPKEEQKAWQILQSETVENEEVLII